MTFAKLLEQVGGMGRFQVINVILLTLPIILLASHNLLQNFTAAIPDHRCRDPVNDTCGANATESLKCKDFLRASILMDSNWTLQKCHRFTTKWLSLNSNTTGPQDREETVETCLDGWIYDTTVFTSTIVTEVGKSQGDRWQSIPGKGEIQ